MKLSTVLFFTLVFLFSCKSDVNKLQIGQKTTIKVNEVHDGGTIIKGEVITAKFNVTNTGKISLGNF